MARFNSLAEFDTFKPVEAAPKIRVYVGASTCGIAAGANRVLAVLQKEVAARNLADVEIKKVGCLGFCYSEPNVEVMIDGMPSVLYGKVNESLATQIVERHLVQKQILDQNIYDKSYIDILKK